MTHLLVPVRYPLSTDSRATLAAATNIARDRNADLTVLHINLSQNGTRTTKRALQAAVKRTSRVLPDTQYVVREGFFVEESILDEIATQAADIVVIGRQQTSHIRRFLRRLSGNADIERYLRETLDCELITVPSPSS